MADDPQGGAGGKSDPTKNVLDLVEAAIARQDDLRAAESGHIREVLGLRAELFSSQNDCANEIAELRAQHGHELRTAEAARIDAIRDVDVKAAQRTAEVQSSQAAALAAQVSTTAEAARATTAATAAATATALTAALDPIIKDVADLRRSQYSAEGQRTQVVETQSAGASAGLWVGVGITALTILISAVGVIAAIVSNGS